MSLISLRLPGLLRAHSPVPWRVVGTVGLFGVFAALTWWAASSMALEVRERAQEFARYERQQVFVAALTQQLSEARRAEAALAIEGPSRDAGFQRWEKAIAAARRTLLSVYGQSGFGERSLAMAAIQQLDIYIGLLDRAWLPPGSAGAAPNPAPLIARAGDHMTALLNTASYLSIIARNRSEISQSMVRSATHSFSELGFMAGWWLSGTLMIAAGIAALNERPRGRGKRSESQVKPALVADASGPDTVIPS